MNRTLGLGPRWVAPQSDELNVSSCRHSETKAQPWETIPLGGARYRVRTCDPYRVKVVLYH
jgi:hypothetical protein